MKRTAAPRHQRSGEIHSKPERTRGFARFLGSASLALLMGAGVAGFGALGANSVENFDVAGLSAKSMSEPNSQRTAIIDLEGYQEIGGSRLTYLTEMTAQVRTEYSAIILGRHAVIGSCDTNMVVSGPVISEISIPIEGIRSNINSKGIQTLSIDRGKVRLDSHSPANASMQSEEFTVSEGRFDESHQPCSSAVDLAAAFSGFANDLVESSLGAIGIDNSNLPGDSLRSFQDDVEAETRNRLIESAIEGANASCVSDVQPEIDRDLTEALQSVFEIQNPDSQDFSQIEIDFSGSYSDVENSNTVGINFTNNDPESGVTATIGIAADTLVSQSCGVVDRGEL